MTVGFILPLTLAAATAGQQAPEARGDTALARAVRYIDAAVADRMRSEGIPGLALAVVANDSIATVRCYGVADLATRAPVVPETRFLAGSISKAFTAVALLQLSEEGLVDLDRPINDYLPWFKARSAPVPITLHHVLTHTAGLPRDRSDLPSSPYTALALRDRVLELPAGSRFAYSNLGYQLVSLVIEEVEGRPFQESIQRRILDPLRLMHSEAAVTQEGRFSTATGYQYAFDDRPPRPDTPLVPAVWSEYSAGDANIVTTAPDLGRFLAALLHQGEVAGRRLLQPRSFVRMTQRTVPAPELGAGEFYGYGVIMGRQDDDPVLWHSGGLLGFHSMLIGDVVEGVGVVLLMNGPGDTRGLGEYALSALVAARRHAPIPPVPIAAPADSIWNSADYGGTWVDSAGARIQLRADGSRLQLDDGRQAGPLLRAGPDAFVTGAERWALYPLRAQRQDGEVVGLTHGPRWFWREGQRPPPSPPAPARWQSYVGHYRAEVSYFSNYRVILRRGQLLLVSPDGMEERLTPDGTDEFRVGNPVDSPERLTFHDVVSGRALRLNLSGTDYYRTTSP